MDTQSDSALIEEGLRTLARGQCVSVIVATNEAGVRNYHQCTVDLMHGHKTHHCGCGESWRYVPGDNRWSAVGPLTDVVHSS